MLLALARITKTKRRLRNNVLNAGVDVNGFRPVTFDELVENTRKSKALHATRGKPV